MRTKTTPDGHRLIVIALLNQNALFLTHRELSGRMELGRRDEGDHDPSGGSTPPHKLAAKVAFLQLQGLLKKFQNCMCGDGQFERHLLYFHGKNAQNCLVARRCHSMVTCCQMTRYDS